MFDFNSILIGFVKLLLITGFIFSFVSFCIKLKQDMGNYIDFDMFGLALWNRRWRAFIMIVIFFGMVFMFNLEQVHRPKNKLSDHTEATTMGYEDTRDIIIRKTTELDREIIYAENKEQAETAKKAFKRLE